jgi:hypothetical protein
MPRFAVLEHESPRGLHWDLLLEHASALAAWALPEPPDAPHVLSAPALPDHRLAYLDYEGPISDGRGRVACWDRGTFHAVQWGVTTIVVMVQGSRLRGRASLRRDPQRPERWEFSFDPSTGEKRGKGGI